MQYMMYLVYVFRRDPETTIYESIVVFRPVNNEISGSTVRFTKFVLTGDAPHWNP